jgi:lysophospholipase L1-like esterase
MKKIWIGFLSAFLFSAAQAQNPALEKEVLAYQKGDSLVQPPRHPIVFAGSSSFRLWEDFQHEFKEYTVLNRGFGGSTLIDLRYWLHDLVLAYQPKQVVIYCGENDLASSDTVTAEMVTERFKGVFSDLRAWMPDVPVVFVSLKPSPSRAHLFEKMKESNRLISEFLRTQRNTAYVDVFSAMLNPDGTPVKGLFVNDMLHMNGEGYEIWRNLIKPHLLK